MHFRNGFGHEPRSVGRPIHRLLVSDEHNPLIRHLWGQRGGLCSQVDSDRSTPRAIYQSNRVNGFQGVFFGSLRVETHCASRAAQWQHRHATAQRQAIDEFLGSGAGIVEQRCATESLAAHAEAVVQNEDGVHWTAATGRPRAGG